MSNQHPECVFCPDPHLLRQPGRTAHAWTHVASPVRIHSIGADTFAVFEPLAPVTPGHLLVVPARHVEDAAASPHLAGMATNVASAYAGRAGQANIITSIGPNATQSVFHLHVHVVPRRPGDGLHLPWTGQSRSPRQLADV